MIYDVLKLSIEQADPDFRRVYKHCCERLELNNPEIYLFSWSHKGNPTQYGNWIFRNGQLIAPRNHKDWKGFARQFNKDVFIRAGLTKKETLLTLMHELYHLWEYKIGKACVDELLAEDFAIENYNKLKNNQI